MKRAALVSLLAPAMAASAGCHSYHIETVVENRTGGPVQLLEVDYPNASFGKNTLAAGSDYHYRIQVSGIGPIKVQYATGNGSQTVQISGPEIAQGQEGRLEIVLQPQGKAEFHPELTPRP